MKEMELKLLYDLVEALVSELPPEDSLRVAARKLMDELSPHMELESLEILEKLTEDRLKRMTGEN